MIEATTPTITLRLPEEVNLQNATRLYVTFKQQSIVITKSLGDGIELPEPNVIAVTLSQEETLRFVPKFMVDIQVNWMVGSSRFATKVKRTNVLENLMPEVIV